MLALNDFLSKNRVLETLMTFGFPIIYGFLSAGVITVFLAKDYVGEIAFLSDISNFLNYPIAIIISVITIATTIFLSKIIYIKTWNQLEI